MITAAYCPNPEHPRQGGCARGRSRSWWTTRIAPALPRPRGSRRSGRATVTATSANDPSGFVEAMTSPAADLARPTDDLSAPIGDVPPAAEDLSALSGEPESADDLDYYEDGAPEEEPADPEAPPPPFPPARRRSLLGSAAGWAFHKATDAAGVMTQAAVDIARPVVTPVAHAAGQAALVAGTAAYKTADPALRSTIRAIVADRPRGGRPERDHSRTGGPGRDHRKRRPGCGGFQGRHRRHRGDGRPRRRHRPGRHRAGDRPGRHRRHCGDGRSRRRHRSGRHRAGDRPGRHRRHRGHGRPRCRHRPRRCREGDRQGRPRQRRRAASTSTPSPGASISTPSSTGSI